MDEQTQILNHLEVLEVNRNGTWENVFFDLIAHSRITVIDPEPRQGPDSWPYLFCSIEKSSSEPLSRTLSWLTDRGIGLVINPQKDVPDYIFTYGMLCNFRQRGEFLSANDFLLESKSPSQEALQLSANTPLLAGPPKEEYFPTYARKVLKQFFLDQGLFNVRLLLMSTNTKDFDLCFSLESLGNPPSGEHHGILEALSWFLPSHYSLALISESGLPKFHDL